MTAARLVGCSLALLLATSVASAEIFKCVARSGADLYQNFPCDVESIGSITTPVPAAAPQGDSKRQKPDSNVAPASGSVVPARSAGPPIEPRVGMTPSEVRGAWGEPTETRWDEPGVGARSEVWSYGASRSVRFVKNRVSSIEQ